MRGGKRKGAGRKQGYAAKSAEEARRVFAELVSAEIGPIAQALIKKAKKGDIRAIRELLDRAYGRPLQPIEQKATPLDFGAMVVEARKRYSGSFKV